MRVSARRPAEVEHAMMFGGADSKLVAVDFDLRLFEQLFAALRGDADLRAGADLDIVRASDFDRLEITDLEVARDGRARVFAAMIAAGDGGGGGDNDGCG